MFSGVPVRRALLRESNELDKITRRLGALMLIIPQASVTVVDTSRQMTVLSLPRVNSVLERIYSLHSSLRNTKLVAVDWYDNDLLHHVAGWVSRPSDSTGSTSYHLQRIRSLMSVTCSNDACAISNWYP
jgi:DNA mismatch repair ATPase MutL